MTICVEDVMVREVVTIDENQSAKNAARLMTKFGISGLIVLSKGNLVGIVTQRDIITRVVSSGNSPDDVKVKNIMTEPVIAVNSFMPLEQAVRIMFQEKIKKLPVVDRRESKLKLVGILSLTDVARLQPTLLEGLRTLGEMSELELEMETSFYVR
ncbi:MAG TPA: CBS domain-containing protein [Patescibacteria group bacterium]|nr:CBS domain-containing protein [Patescibacteria group bacterium]